MPEEKATAGKKGGFSFKSLFVQEVEDEAPAAPVGPPAGLRAGPAGLPAARQVAVPPPLPMSVIDEAMLGRLMEQLTSEAPKGYVEFLGDLQTLADALPTEELQYKAALKLAAKQGHNSEVLALDFEKTIRLLEEQGRQFNEDAAQQVQAKVGTRQAEVTRLNQEIAAKQAELEALHTKLAAESDAITADTAKIESAKTKFAGAYAAAHAQITDQKAKITYYGKV